MKVIDKEKIATEFGAFIREAREERGLLQADIANQLEISRSYLAHIESGNREIYFSLAVNICQVLNLNINDFMKRLK